MTRSRSTDSFQPGDLLNNTYRIESLLGRGGTSDVYRARSEISGRKVAIKVLQAELSGDENYLRLMTREEAIRDVRHDAVVRYSENQRTPDGQVYLVMDYVEGTGLDERLRSGGMSAEDLVKVAARVAQGLTAAHARNLVHRDLSPDNIILRNGKPEEAVIIDFGIAKDDNPGAETIVGNEFAGKYAYAAPEQLNGHSDVRSDIYALGALLLATYRGKAPHIGKNPVELMRIKDSAPDLEGVPEPLRSLVARMMQPDPAQRFQTAEDVLRAIDPTYVPGHVIRTSLPYTAKPPPAPPKSRKGPLAALAILAAMAAAIGVYYTGLIPGFGHSALPLVSPYLLTVQQGEDGGQTASGHVPDAAMRDALIERMAGGAQGVTLARGNIPDGWSVAALAVLDAVADLPEWQIAIRDDEARVTGLGDRAGVVAARAALAASRGPIRISSQIDIGPRLLQSGPVAETVVAQQDCGPLLVDPPPPIGWALDDAIRVTGRVADDASRIRIAKAVEAIAGQRHVAVDVEVLNPNLCKIEAALPNAGPGGFKVVFGFGDRDAPNPAGRYFVGENPVIDVVIPADVTTGNLWVSVVDVTGSVFHLLPNLNRPANDVATLRGGAAGPVSVRVAYGIAEAADTTKMAFVVDDTALGKSKVVVLHADRQVFESLRPMSESTDSFAAALASTEANADMAKDFTIDSQVLTTEKK